MPSQEGRSLSSSAELAPVASTMSVEPSLEITSVPHALACQSAIRSGSRATGIWRSSRRIRPAVSDAGSILLVPSRRRVPFACASSIADSAARRHRRTDAYFIDPSRIDTTKSASVTICVGFIAVSRSRAFPQAHHRAAKTNLSLLGLTFEPSSGITGAW
jgi:hypothetical protein